MGIIRLIQLLYSMEYGYFYGCSCGLVTEMQGIIAALMGWS